MVERNSPRSTDAASSSRRPWRVRAFQVGVVLFAVLFVVSSLTTFTGFHPFTDTEILPQARTVARVNGKEIRLAAFLYRFDLLRTLASPDGQPLPLSEALADGLPEAALSQLVDVELLAQWAPKLGLATSDAELFRSLVKDRRFQKDGRFDRETYERVLRTDSARTTVQFEQELRDAATATKVLDAVRGSANVSEEEVRAYFDRKWNKVHIRFARFSPTLYEQDPFLESELSRYLAGHQTELNERLKSLPSFGNSPTRVRSRHLMLELPLNAPESESAQVKAKLLELRTKLAEGQTFEALAKAHSQDPLSARIGGDLGFSPLDMLHPAYVKALAQLKPGEVSGPVRTDSGWHLIQLVERQQGKTLDRMGQLRELARQTYRQERARKLAHTQALAALATLKSGKSLESVLASTPKAPSLQDSGEYEPRSASIPVLGVSASIQSEITQLAAPGPLPRVLPLGDDWLVIEVVSRTRPTEELWSEARDRAWAELLNQKQEQLAIAFTRQLAEGSDIFRDVQLMEQHLQ